MARFMIVSSAKSRMLLCIFSAMSLIYETRGKYIVLILEGRLAEQDKHLMFRHLEQHADICMKGIIGFWKITAH